MLRRWIALAALVGGACVSIEPLPFDVAGEDGDLLVIATVDTAGEVTARATRWRAGSPYVTVPDGGALHVWIVRAGDLVDPSGAPLTADALDAVEVRPDTEGRCRGRTNRAPQIVYGGDVCEVPPFAEHFAAPANAAAPELALVWPGETVCEPEFNEVPRGVEWSLVDPDPDFWPHARYAVAPNGTVAAIGEHHGITIASSGARATLPPERAPFSGPILAAVGTADGRFIVSSGNERIEIRGEVTEFDVGLNLLRGPRSIDFRAESIHALGNGDLLLAGEGSTKRQPKARVCDASLETCSDLNTDDLEPTLGRALLGAAALADGTHFVHGDHGFLVLERLPRFDEVTGIVATSTEGRTYGELTTASGSIAWQAVGKAFAGFEGDTGAYRMLNARALEGGGVVICAFGTRSLVLLGRIDRRYTSVRPPPLEILTELTGPCSGISEIPERGAVRVTTTAGASAIVDSNGLIESEDRSEYPGVGVPWYMETFADGTTIATTESGAIFKRSGLEPFTSIYAPSTEPLGVAVDVFTLGGETFALNRNGTINILGGGTRALASSSTSTIVAAVRTGDAILAAVRDPGGVRLRRTDGEIWLDEGQSIDVADVRDLAVVASGAVVLVDSSGGLFVVDDGETRRVRIEWDDPESDDVEGPPGQPFGCGFSNGPTDVLRGVGAWGGSAWAVGCDDVLLRVDVYAEPLTATRVDFVPMPAKPHSFTSVTPTCPDTLLLTTGNDGQNVPRVWSFGPCEGGPCGVDGDRFSAPPAALPYTLGAALRVTRDGARTLVIHEGGVHFLGSDDLFRLEDTPWRGGFSADGTPWFVTMTGRAFRGPLQ